MKPSTVTERGSESPRVLKRIKPTKLPKNYSAGAAAVLNSFCKFNFRPRRAFVCPKKKGPQNGRLGHKGRLISFAPLRRAAESALKANLGPFADPSGNRGGSGAARSSRSLINELIVGSVF